MDKNIRFGSQEWMDRENAKPRKEPDPAPATMTERRPRRPKRANFIDLALELRQSQTRRAQASVTDSYLGIREPLIVTNIGGEGSHFKSTYESLAQLMKGRRLLGRETLLHFADGFSLRELEGHLERQGGQTVYRLFLDEVGRCKVIGSRTTC